MSNNPEQIAERVREMRTVLELTTAECADKLGVSEQQYRDYEANVASIPISSLYKLADLFGVDFTVLMTGEGPSMGAYSLVRSGQGANVDRCPGYSFQALAYNYKGRTMEPMIVTLEPKAQPEDEAALITHGGQEFNLVLEGSIRVVVGKREFVLNEGDSLYFDPSLPHGQRAIGKTARFLTIIQKEP
ncbi:MAG: helix-turn-helix transcriptional regulator [Victivallales bacterium]|nr:helix-turn-helix transcriptional regulator [Victivallales bacterium]